MDYWIVVVDDEPLSLTNAKNLLRANNMRTSCLRSGSELLDFVAKHTPDLILLDVLMPEMDGFETYRALRQFEADEGRPEIPVIFLTGEDNREAERRGLKAGASDFIHKPFDEDILIKRINNTIFNSKIIESLKEKATLDKLTGFLNRASGTEKISSICRTETGALMILDLDNFKLVNDLFGHDMGDRVLVAFSRIVRLNIRSYDVVCRIGGDEFVGFFADMTDDEAVRSLTERLNAQLMREAEILMGEDHGIPLGISVGIAYCNNETRDYQILFQYADNALYEAKRNGRHSFSVYNPDAGIVNVEDDIERDLMRLTQIMSERGEGKGAMILGQEAFSWNYRFIERFLSRYCGVALRILFSLSSDETGVIFSEMVSEFGNILRNTLRKSDMILQWQQKEYFVVLPLLTEEDGNNVVERIMQAWKLTAYPERLHIKYVTSLLKNDEVRKEED